MRSGRKVRTAYTVASTTPSEPVRARSAADGALLAAREMHGELAGRGVGGDLDEAEACLVGPGGPSPQRTISTAVGLPRWLVASIVAVAGEVVGGVGAGLQLDDDEPSVSANPTASTPGIRRSSSSRSSRLTVRLLCPRGAGVDPERQGAHRQHQRGDGRVVDLRVEVEARLRVVQACSSLRNGRRPARNTCRPSSGTSTTTAASRSPKSRDKVIEGQIDGGDARTRRAESTSDSTGPSIVGCMPSPRSHGPAAARYPAPRATVCRSNRGECPDVSPLRFGDAGAPNPVTGSPRPRRDS